MARVSWMACIPVVLAAGLGGRALLNPVITRGSDGRIIDSRFEEVQKQSEQHLYAPTWLPHGGKVGVLGTLTGQRRVMQDFLDQQDRTLCILSQEPRSKDRDAYHRNLFERQADAEVHIGQSRGYLVTGDTGERRLFWNEERMALILSSTILTDTELVKVASGMR